MPTVNAGRSTKQLRSKRYVSLTMRILCRTMVLEPVFDDGNPPCYMGVYKTYLHPGAFVIVSGEECICHRILEIVGSDKIILQQFIRFVGSNIPHHAITEPHAKYIPEVCCTSKTVTVKSNEITDIAFVFKAKAVLEGTVRIAQGMRNSFILRFDDDGNTISEQQCLPFPCDYLRNQSLFGTSFSCHIWNNLNKFHREMARIMGRTAERAQGLFTKAPPIKIGIDASVWHYIRESAISGEDDCCIPVHKVSANTIVRWTKPALAIAKIKEENNGELIRFETAQDLICLCGIFGETATCNVRARPPRKGEESEDRQLKENDGVNIVNGSNEREEPFQRRTQKDGIDFVFDGRSTVSVYLRYSLHRYNTATPPSDSIVSVLLTRKRPLSSIHQDEDDSEESHTVCITDEFEHDGRLYRVQSITNDSIAAICFYPPRFVNPLFNTVKTFDNKEYVKERIMARL